MMYTVYDYSLLTEPFDEEAPQYGETFFSTDPQAYLSMISVATDTSLPDLEMQNKQEFTHG